MIKLYPFQERSVDFALTHHYSLNCSEMGLGKSITALTAAKRSGLKLAVFAPPFLKKSWQSEGMKLGIDFKFVPYSQLHKFSTKDLERYRFWVGDEIHYCKSPTAQRTHAFYSLLKSCRPEYFLGLTGTPIKNRVPDFWTLLGFCSQNPQKTSGLELEGNLRKYHGFCRHFCEVEKMFIGRGRIVDKYTVLRKDRVTEFKSLLKDKMIRYRVEDVLKDLPEITRKVVRLELEETPGLEAEFEAYMKGHKTNIEGKKKNALVKAPVTARYCNDIHEESLEPLLVFTDHVDSAKVIGQMLKGRVEVITGQISSEMRGKIVEDFQNRKIDAIVATIGSMSVGVTLTAARHVVFNDLSWVPADNLQAEKRIHRIGQKSACFSHFIVSSRTDEYIQKTLVSKLETIATVLEG